MVFELVGFRRAEYLPEVTTRSRAQGRLDLVEQEAEIGSEKISLPQPLLTLAGAPCLVSPPQRRKERPTFELSLLGEPSGFQQGMDLCTHRFVNGSQVAANCSAPAIVACAN